MTLTLILIRHAKSDWGDPMQQDHDRPLNERGRMSAPRIGAWLAQQGVMPDTVLCSTARRTQETWEGIAPYLPGAPAPQLLPALYHASPDRMLAALHGAKGGTVAMIAHNPGIGSLAWMLCATPPEHAAFDRYPTGATLILAFPTSDWAEVRAHMGVVQAFATPRDLPDPE